MDISSRSPRRGKAGGLLDELSAQGHGRATSSATPTPRRRSGSRRRGHFLASIGLCLFAILCLSLGAKAGAEEIATSQVEQATVMVQGAEVGTGFAILNRGDYTYLVTAAHLIDRDAYQADARLPKVQQKPNTAWLTAYDPKDGSPHDAAILGSADFRSDVVVIRVQGLAHRPRAMCLAAHLPVAARFVVSSFQENIIQNPTSGKPFDNEHATLAGSEGTLPPVADRPFLFQYSAPEEVGFSGSPLVDVDTGAVFGVAQGSPMVVDPTNGATVVSRVMRYGVSIDSIRHAIDEAKADDPALDNLPVIVEDDRGNLLPNLTQSGRKLRIMVFDQPLNGADPKNLSPIYAWYDSAMRRVIKQAFHQADTSPTLDPVTAVYPIDTDIHRIRNLCLTSDFKFAVGVIGIRRTLTSLHGARTLESRVGLISCRGHVIDSTDLVPAAMNGGGPDGSQIAQYAASLSAALTTLAGPDGTRLQNFAADGLPLGDSESRGFYAVRHEGSTTSLGYGWADGEAADFSKLYADSPVTAIDTISQEQLNTLSPAELDDALDRAGGNLIVTYGALPAGFPAPLEALRSADRCVYFWRLFKKGADELPTPPERKETI